MPSLKRVGNVGPLWPPAVEATATFPALDSNADALLWEWLTESTREDLRFDTGKNLRLFAKNSRLQ